MLNAAMSVDGKIASRVGDCEFSDDEDWKRVHKLRASVDAIMVGRRTIETDDSKLTIKSFPDFKIPISKFPTRVVVDGLAKTPATARIFTVELEHYPSILATTTNAPKEKLDEIRALGVKVLVCGKGPRVDLVHLMRDLRTMNIRTLLLEGGGTLNFSMLENDLIDEVSLSVAPVLVGGLSATSLIGGKGFDKIKHSCQLELIEFEKLGKNLFVRYLVRRNGEKT
ncbi:MAG: dihydrofolate reductase family protein [Candidatus Helarchaeota archaeon]